MPDVNETNVPQGLAQKLRGIVFAHWPTTMLPGQYEALADELTRALATEQPNSSAQRCIHGKIMGPNDVCVPEQSKDTPCVIDPAVPDDCPDRADCLRAGEHVCGAKVPEHAQQDAKTLKAFCREILREVADGHDLDGADLQDLALTHGLLREVTVTEPD